MMRRNLFVAVLMLAWNVRAEVPAEKVRIDAMVVDRVVELSKRSIPEDLLRRLVTEDLEMLRGSRRDGGYDYAYYDRYEAQRHSESFSIRPAKDADHLEEAKVSRSYVFRLIMAVPARRLLVTKNRKIWIDRVELEYIAQGSSDQKRQTFEIRQWIEPGESRTVELPVIPTQATARVFARTDPESGYGNLTLTLIEARIIDDVKSPYAAATASTKNLLRLIEAGKAGPIRSGAVELRNLLSGPATTVEVVTVPREAEVTPIPDDLHRQIQAIEDLLTGTDAERREALERLHQLERRLRPR